jgi:outer membrane autotransporter protein
VSDADAGFVGSTTRFTAVGAGREDDVATVGLGAWYKVSQRFSLYGAYEGELGDSAGHNLNVGLRFTF